MDARGSKIPTFVISFQSGRPCQRRPCRISAFLPNSKPNLDSKLLVVQIWGFVQMLTRYDRRICVLTLPSHAVVEGRELGVSLRL